MATRSGEKYTTAQGFTAIKDGIKQSHAAAENPRKPHWLRAPLATGAAFGAVKSIVREHRLSTVCEEAKCPNIGECWNAGTATIMLMGSVCTRACRFCAVDTGNPRGWLDAQEPENVAKSVQLMRLKYVVLTSVNRDDLPDGGACIRQQRIACSTLRKITDPGHRQFRPRRSGYRAGDRLPIDVGKHGAHALADQSLRDGASDAVSRAGYECRLARGIEWWVEQAHIRRNSG